MKGNHQKRKMNVRTGNGKQHAVDSDFPSSGIQMLLSEPPEEPHLRYGGKVSWEALGHRDLESQD